MLSRMNSRIFSRRDFLGASAVGAAALTHFPSVLKGAEPDRKLRIGLIGCGWYGMVDVKAAFKAGGVEVVGLCDADSEHLQKSAEEVVKLQGKRPSTFKKHEDLLKEESLEAVIIASPPQWHALHLLAALQRGLDVYCEKPLSYDIREGRAMVDAVKKSGKVVQIGFQRRQSAAFKAVREYIQGGDAGRIVCAEANIHYTAGTKDPTPQEPPASLDWDLWCGPAPKIPYSPQVGHMNWRLEKTTGHGHLVDWGIHLIDAARVILGEGAPTAVTASGGLYYLKGKITTPDVLNAHFEFPTCPLTWRHRIWGAEEHNPDVSNGIFFFGEQQTIFVTDNRWEVIPRGKGKERKVQQADSDAGTLHMAEFLNAVRQKTPPGCLIEDAFLSTAAVKLAMISYETGSKVVWDSQSGNVVGNPAAAKLLKREYRAPWRHPWTA
jgi:predicted dehydrogenase